MLSRPPIFHYQYKYERERTLHKDSYATSHMHQFDMSSSSQSLSLPDLRSSRCGVGIGMSVAARAIRVGIGVAAWLGLGGDASRFMQFQGLGALGLLALTVPMAAASAVDATLHMRPQVTAQDRLGHTLPLLFSDTPINREAIADCVRTKIVSGKRYRNKNEYQEFNLDYGDAALEVFHSLSLLDLKKIDYLEECCRELESRRLFWDRSQESRRRAKAEEEKEKQSKDKTAQLNHPAYPEMPTPDQADPIQYEHGGSNITFLTGLMQFVLPDVHAKILHSAQTAMSESFLANSRSKSTKKTHGRNWEVDLKSLGVRSVQYTGYYNRQEALKPSEKRRIRLEMRRKIAERREKQKEYERKTYGAEIKKSTVNIGVNLYSKAELEREELVIAELELKEMEAAAKGLTVSNPHADDVDWAAIEYEYDPLADEHLKDYLRTDGATVYTIVILLNDRAQFHGGEVFIRKDKHGHHGFAGAGAGNMQGQGQGQGQGDDEDDYDDEEEVDVGFVGHLDIHPEAHFQGDHGRIMGLTDAERKKSLKEMRKLSLDRASDPHIGTQEYGRPAKEKVAALGNVLKSHPHYSAFHTRISRYTPDRGNLLIIRSDYEHGIQPILNGRRNALVMEFWAYQDALPEELRPASEKQGRPLPRRWQEL
jgi:hypothetical protein